MKRFIYLLAFLAISQCAAFAQNCNKACPITNSETATNCPSYDKSRTDNAIKYKKYVQKVQNDRATVYNALNLSNEQIKIREELTKKNKEIFDQKFDQLSKESYKLKALTCANAGSKELSISKKKSQNYLKKKIKISKNAYQGLSDQNTQ